MRPVRIAGAIRHARVGPCIEVAACGERGLTIAFAVRTKEVSCPRCVELRTDPEIARAQLAKMRKVGEGRRRHFAGGYLAKK